MENDNKINAFDIFLIPLIGRLIEMIVMRFGKRDPSDRFLTNILLLHILIIIILITFSYIISKLL